MDEKEKDLFTLQKLLFVQNNIYVGLWTDESLDIFKRIVIEWFRNEDEDGKTTFNHVTSVPTQSNQFQSHSNDSSTMPLDFDPTKNKMQEVLRRNKLTQREQSFDLLLSHIVDLISAWSLPERGLISSSHLTLYLMIILLQRQISRFCLECYIIENEFSQRDNTTQHFLNSCTKLTNAELINRSKCLEFEANQIATDIKKLPSPWNQQLMENLQHIISGSIYTFGLSGLHLSKE